MSNAVFDFEWARGSKRGRLGALRRVYSFVLLVELIALGGDESRNIQQFAQRALVFFLVQQLVLIVLATPTFVAGAIGDEKTSGSLQFLLIADLTPLEIVLGKCFGRIAQLAVILLVGLPVVGFLAAIAGFPFMVLWFIVGFTLALLFALAGVSALASVWTRQTREAVVAVYMIAAVGLVIGVVSHRLVQPPVVRPGTPPPLVQGAGASMLATVDNTLSPFNLYHVFAPAWSEPDADELAWRLFTSSLAWIGVGAVSLMVAVWRFRPVYLKQLNQRPKPGRWLKRAAPTDEPVRWREASVERAVPLPLIGAIPSWLSIAVLFVALLFWSGYALPRSPDRRLLLVEQSLAVIFFASLMVGIRASGAVTGERQQQTWEVLLTTPLETRELVEGKLRGILDAMTPFLLAYAVFAFIPSIVTFDLVGGGLTLLGLGATWVAMVVLGSAGVLASVRAQGSTQSLINTFATGYGMSNFRCCVEGSSGVLVFGSLFLAVGVFYPLLTGDAVSPLTLFISVVCLMTLLALGPARALMRRADDYLDSAVAYIDKRERTREKRVDDLGPA